MAERDDKPTEVGWLYNAAQQQMLPTTRAQYDQLWDAGWRATPWAFHIETHPSAVPQNLSTAAPVAPSTGDVAARAALEAKVALMEAKLAEMEAEKESTSGRMEALEAKVTSAPATGSSEEATRRPRSS